MLTIHTSNGGTWFRPGESIEAKLMPGRDAPAELLRDDTAALPEVSEMQAVRHYTRLSQKNFSIDTQFYPLGSCTMKYNPRACNSLAMLPGFLARHPLAPASEGQGFLACMYELQEMLCEVTGMAGFSLAPMAGAQGEFAGVARQDLQKRPKGLNLKCQQSVEVPIRESAKCPLTVFELHSNLPQGGCESCQNLFR